MERRISPASGGTRVLMEVVEGDREGRIIGTDGMIATEENEAVEEVAIAAMTEGLEITAVEGRVVETGTGGWTGMRGKREGEEDK